MKINLNDGLQISFDSTDNAELQENPEIFLKTIFEELAKYTKNRQIVISQNDGMNAVFVCPFDIDTDTAVKILSRYIQDFQAEMTGIAEHKASGMLFVSFNTEQELKSGIYGFRRDGTLYWSEHNDNPVLKRFLDIFSG